MTVVRMKPGPYEMAELQNAAKMLSEAWAGLEGCVERFSKKFGQGVWVLFDDAVGHAREAACAAEEAGRRFEDEGAEVEVPDCVKPASCGVRYVVETMRGLLPELDELLGCVGACDDDLDKEPEESVDFEARKRLGDAREKIGSGIDDFEAALRRFDEVHGFTEKEDRDGA